MDTQLQAASQLGGEARVEAFKNLINQLKRGDTIDVGDFKSILQCLVSMKYGAVGQKELIEELINNLQHTRDTATETQCLEVAIEALESSISFFEEQDKVLRHRLADIYQNAEENVKAARVLQGFINGNRKIENREIFETYIRIVRNYLEADQPENAAAFLNKAQYLRPSLSQNAQIDPISDIHFKLCQARIFDSSNDFIRAAMRYYDVSREAEVEEDERLTTLARSVTCIILAQPGPERSQLLKNMYGDERSQQLPQYRILKKVYLEQLLNESDIEELKEQLTPSQMAQNPDGTTVLSRAMIDHNLMSVSRLYLNIGLKDLARLLGLEQAQTEKYTAQMIARGKLEALIDQEQRYVYFDTGCTGAQQLSSNDKCVESAYTLLDDIVEEIEHMHPELRASGS